MDKYMNSVPESLREFTWEGRPMIPVPNEENRELADLIASKEKDFQDIRRKIEEDTKIIELLVSHSANVTRETKSLQEIIKVRKDEFEAGEHVRRLLERESSSLNKRKEILDKETASTIQREESGKKAIGEELKRRKRIENDLKLDHQSMLKWLEDASIIEENIEVLQKCKFKNNIRVKEIEVQVSCVNADAKRWKELANQRYLDILTMQAQADRLAEDFSRSHQQRENTIAQLEMAIESIEKKEVCISRLVEQLNEIRWSESVIQKEITENKKFLLDYRKQNKEVSEEINKCMTQRGVLHSDVIRLQHQVDAAQSELDAERGTASNLTMKISITVAKKKKLAVDIEEYRQRLKQLEEERSVLHETINRWNKQTLTEAEGFRRLEAMLRQAEMKYNRIQQSAEQILSVKAKAMEELKQCDLLQKQMHNNMQNAKLDIRHFRSAKLMLDKKAFQQHEEWCQLDSNILKLEQRVKRMKGDTRKDEELFDLQAEAAKLVKLRDERKANLFFMNSHLARNRDEICRLRKRMEKAKTKKTYLHSKLQETKVTWSGGQGELRKIIASKEDCTADECVLKVKLKHLQNILERRATNVMTLQKYKDKFESDVKKQVKDLKAKKDLLIYENKQADEMRQGAQGKLLECQNEINNKQAKYQNILGALGLGEKSGKEEVDLIIETEKKKAISRNQIDELTDKLEATKKKFTALENTRSLMSATNKAYEVFLSRTDDEKVSLIREMETERDNVLQVTLDEMKEDTVELQQRLSDFSTEIQILEVTANNLEAELETKQFSKEGIKKELKEQDRMLKRADRTNAKIIQMSKKTNPTAFIEETQIRILRELLKQIYDVFSKITYQHPETIERMEDLFARASLPPFVKILPVRSRLRSCSSLSSSSSKSSSSSRTTPSSKRQSTQRALTRPSIVTLGETEFE